MEVISTNRSGSEPQRALGLTLLRLARGRTRWSVEGRSYEMREGQVLFLFPGQTFGGLESTESVPIRVERILLPSAASLTPAILEKKLPFSRKDATACLSALKDSPAPTVKLDPDTAQVFGEMVAQAKKSALTALESAHQRACLVHLLTGIALAAQRQDSPSGGVSPAEYHVAVFLKKLEQTCEEEWTLESMAEGAGFKRSRFGEICRQLTGESPTIYLNRLRVRRSRKLLRETDLSVTQIAFNCGFSSSQYFAKIFRRFQGHEPSHYRRISREMRRGESIHYLKGDSARNVAFANRKIESGDFRIDGKLTLDRLGGTAASVEFGPDRFGFDGREGRLFLEGETFGGARFYQRSADLIHEGIPFHFCVERRRNELSAWINNTLILTINDKFTRPVGKVGLRPLRNGIHVTDLQIDGEPVVLRGIEGA